MTLFGMNGLRGKSAKKVLPSTEAAFLVGKNLTERLWLPDMTAETVDLKAGSLCQAVTKVSETLGTQCHLLYVNMITSKGKSTHV